MHHTFNRQVYLLLFVASLITLYACRGIPVPEDKKDYVGQWQGVGMTLTITDDGGVEYHRTGGSGSKSVTGPLKRFEGNNFVVGALFFTTTFEVQQPPYRDRNAWKMVVDGVELTRPSGPMSKEIPDDQHLIALTGNSIQKLAESINNNDFSILYNSLSKLWQSQITSDQLANIFHQFVEQQIDLTGLKGMEPVFIEQPYIDEEGILTLQGYYPTQPSAVKFTLKYIYEYPDWQLFGIYVNVE